MFLWGRMATLAVWLPLLTPSLVPVLPQMWQPGMGAQADAPVRHGAEAELTQQVCPHEPLAEGTWSEGTSARQRLAALQSFCDALVGQCEAEPLPGAKQHPGRWFVP